MRVSVMSRSLMECGFTLIEILVVIGIIALLIGVATLPFSTWITKYDIERQIYVLHSNLLKARADAMFKNRMNFAVFNENSFSIIEDTDPAPFGYGINNAADTIVLPETAFGHPINKASTITFDARGLTSQMRTICVYSEVAPDIDCIVVHRARINMGKIIRQEDDCIAENCSTR